VLSFYVQNFGCRASQADGAGLEAQLLAGGYIRAGDGSSADVVVLNTCTVTNTADDEVRQIVRRVHRANPNSKIVVTGCYAQRAPEEVAGLPGVHMVVGNSHKDQLVQLLAAPYHGEVHVGDIFAQRHFRVLPVENAPGDRSRPNLKIQDGCPNRCSFCIIPFVRGASRSASVDDIVQQVCALSAEYPEIVLTGINLGRWGREPGMNMRLHDLLRLLLRETDVRHLRLSSVEPMDWSSDLLELMAATPRIAKHVHAPLQSGADSVLRRMHRKYRPHHYESRIRLARNLMPDAAIGADVMTGFPGESEDEFKATLDFVGRLPFTYLHVFPYSERPGTPAADAAEQVPWAVRKERGRRLIELAAAKNLAFRQKMLGKALPAVTLANGQAISTNYLQVELAAPRPERSLITVHVGSLSQTGVTETTPFSILAPGSGDNQAAAR
jgi:threonylcarbamoyladenosine tRNA methylthiotransferase MtaB